MIIDDAQQDQKQPVGYRRWSVVQVGHPLLATKSSWELYAETAEEVIKIQPADGRITRRVYRWGRPGRRAIVNMVGVLSLVQANPKSG